eukprot:scaffold303632_cov47-Attheya_sp.AAC.1
MATPVGLIKNKGGKEIHTNNSTSTSKRGKRVQFSGVDEEEERTRSKRGVEIRRQRKECKAVADQNRNGRIHATIQILQTGNQTRVAALVRLCSNNGENDVDFFLRMCLDDFVPPNQNVRARLAAFHQMPANCLEDLSGQAQNHLMYLHGEPSFAQTFRAYLSSAVVTSGSESDSPRTRHHRSTRRGKMAPDCSES